MLTAELLKAQTELAELPETAIAKIVSMSKIDEDTVIGNKVADIYNRLDADIEKASGLKKNTSEKTYEFAQRALKEVKEAGSSEIQSQLATLQTEKAELEKKIKNGDLDGAAKKKLEELESKLTDKEGELKQWKQKHKDDIGAKEKELEAAMNEAMGVRVDYQFQAALSGLKLKDDATIPRDVKEAYIHTAKQAILSELKPEFIDDGNGGKVMVFKKGEEIQRNRDNGLQPVTAADLLSQRLAPIIDTGRQATGAGTKAGAPAAGHANGTLQLSGARTQVEAVEQISQHLLSQGIAKGTVEFHEKLSEISTENNVPALPFQ